MEQVGLVLIGAVVSLLGQFMVREWNRRDRADERFEAGLVKHREDLTRALAEFFSACATRLDLATSYCDADSRYSAAVDGLKREEYFKAWLDAQEQFSSAQTDVRVKGFRLLLLVDRADDLVSEVTTMMEPLPRDRVDLRPVVKPRREQLDKLTIRLEGLFQPQRQISPGTFEAPADGPRKLLR